MHVLPGVFEFGDMLRCMSPQANLLTVAGQQDS
jgi:hypothetical protein